MITKKKNWPDKTEYGTLKWLIEECEKYNLVGVFAPHNQTGSNREETLLAAADYWVEMKDILKDHSKTMILNIANEWMGEWDAENWSKAYVKAVQKLREAGIKNTIIVDVAGWGQDATVLYKDEGKWAKAVIAADPLNNIMFSIHMYHVAGKDKETVRTNIDAGLALGVPLLIGEFAFEHKAHLEYPNGGPVAWQEILNYTREKRVSYLAWSWTGNGGGAETCDMFDGNGSILENGKCMIYGNNGILMTSTDCSVFDENPKHDSDYEFPTLPDSFKPYDGPGSEFVEWDPNAPDANYSFNQYLPYYINDWNSKEFHIRPWVFSDSNGSYYLEITLENYHGGSQLQIAYNNLDKAEGDRWTKIYDAKNISEDVYIFPLGAEAKAAHSPQRAVNVGATYDNEIPDDILRHLKDENSGGLYIKGKNFGIKDVKLYNGSGVLTGVEDVESDEHAAVEIYDMMGNRVRTMEAGGIYIVKEGSKVRKVRK